MVPHCVERLRAGQGHPGPSLGVWASPEKDWPPRKDGDARRKCGVSGVGSSPSECPTSLTHPPTDCPGEQNMLLHEAWASCPP